MPDDDDKSLIPILGGTKGDSPYGTELNASTSHRNAATHGKGQTAAA